jgi:hypothetical protein
MPSLVLELIAECADGYQVSHPCIDCHDAMDQSCYVPEAGSKLHNNPVIANCKP